MEVIRCAVCDDDASFLKQIETNILAYAKQKQLQCRIDTYSSGEELLQSEEQYDVYFLDMQMNELDGMQTAVHIRTRNEKAVIVFISGYIQYAARGYRVNAVRYILKPQLDEEFNDCMDAVVEKLELNEETLEIRVDSKMMKIKISDIIYIENVKRKVYIHMKGSNHLVYGAYAKITELAEDLHDFGFIYCHAAYLVNAKEIAEICQSEFILFSGERVPISRQRYLQAQREYYFG
ncbi:MAG: response regulator transcription factor, partial [Clostridia bacterium]|nr:response regulator transcription factor [Clostridia bacterium]